MVNSCGSHRHCLPSTIITTIIVSPTGVEQCIHATSWTCTDLENVIERLRFFKEEKKYEDLEKAIQVLKSKQENLKGERFFTAAVVNSFAQIKAGNLWPN